MQSKAPSRIEIEDREQREQQLSAFISNALNATPSGQPDAIQLIARSADSLVTRILFSMSDELGASPAWRAGRSRRGCNRGQRELAP